MSSNHLYPQEIFLDMNNSNTLKMLVDKIQAKTGFTHNEISIKAGYSGGTLGQYFARNSGHEKIINRLKEVFKNELKIISEPDIISELESNKEQIQRLLVQQQRAEKLLELVSFQVKILTFELGKLSNEDPSLFADRINKLLSDFQREILPG